MQGAKGSLLTIEQLQDAVNKIITDYEKTLKGTLDRKRASYSIGFQISALREYEIEAGLYPSRSITVLPKSAQILDLLLIYNSLYGKIRYELSMKSEGKNKYRIYKNNITPYNEDDISDHPDKQIVIDPIINIEKPPSNKSPRLERKKRSPPERLPQTQTFLCPTKNRYCCYLKDNHSPACNNCCYGEEHCHL